MRLSFISIIDNYFALTSILLVETENCLKDTSYVPSKMMFISMNLSFSKKKSLISITYQLFQYVKKF